MPFLKAEDPHGVLQKMKGDEFIHGEDNCIEYKKATTKEGSITRFVSPFNAHYITVWQTTNRTTVGEPGLIGIGDIVEVELNFRWFIDRDSQAQFWVGFHSVTLIDDSTRKVSGLKSIL